MQIQMAYDKVYSSSDNHQLISFINQMVPCVICVSDFMVFKTNGRPVALATKN